MSDAASSGLDLRRPVSIAMGSPFQRRHTYTPVSDNGHRAPLGHRLPRSLPPSLAYHQRSVQSVAQRKKRALATWTQCVLLEMGSVEFLDASERRAWRLKASLLTGGMLVAGACLCGMCARGCGAGGRAYRDTCG
jgi:hypothetical protein